MNKVKEKLKKLTNRQKQVIVGGILIFLLVITSFGLKTSLANPDDGYLKDQTVEGLTFEKANLVYEKGISTFTVEVVNEIEEEYSIKNIEIVFKNGDGEEIESLIGYIGEKIAIDSSKTIQASIDEELSEIASIEYIINK